MRQGTHDLELHVLEVDHTDNLGLFGPSEIEGGDIFGLMLGSLRGLQERQLIVSRDAMDGLVCGTARRA